VRSGEWNSPERVVFFSVICSEGNGAGTKQK